ncbi:MAG: FAD/NAD(P)-binding protein, partial [Acidimicrobiia bacterium]|nr:FAD/NAD(P)-binding protein [Acidimicrobiia bacterium]
MTPVAHRVVWHRQDLHDTVTLALEPVADGLPPPAPGQFAMLWAFGVGEAPISFAGTDDGLWVHTIRSVGPVTAALCAARTGDQIGVRGPFGTGWPLARARGGDVVIMAGGLGLAPVRPIVTEVLARRADFGRVVLLVGARSPDDLLYRAELDEWARPGQLDVLATVDTASHAWRGDVGVVTRLVDRVPFDPDTTRAFVCGPEVMMRF